MNKEIKLRQRTRGELLDILLEKDLEIVNLKQELERYKNIIDEAIKELETLLPLCIMPNNTLIHATEKAKVIEKAINTLQGSDNSE